jgi:multiple sugar transport system ATP-binding protein
MAQLVLKNVVKRYDDNLVVKDFNLTIQDKEFIVLVGPSGCGKTTTLRMIAGLEDISAGELYINDRLVNDVEPKDRDIAMVFQSYALYPHMSVFENMAFGLQLRKFPKAEIERRVREAAEILCIGHLLDRKPKALSGGQRQRVALGRAIVREPQVFLMDEPLSNLDANLRVQMRAEIAKLRHRLEATVVYVTHDQTEAMTMGDRIVVMKDGIVQQVDAPISLYNDPANLFVARFIGSPAMNFVGVTLADQAGVLTAMGPGFAMPLPQTRRAALVPWTGKDIVLGIRPDAIRDDAAFATAQPHWGVEVDVDVVEPMGSESYVYFSLGTASCVARLPPSTTARVKARHRLTLDLDQAHFFDATTEAAITRRPAVGDVAAG